MARLDDLHWQAEPGDNWTSLAAACGCTRKELLTVNGLSTTNPPAVKAGQIVHTPLVAAVTV